MKLLLLITALVFSNHGLCAEVGEADPCIIGCGHNGPEENGYRHTHRGVYTIDINSEMEPDTVADITDLDDEQLRRLEGRFTHVYAEQVTSKVLQDLNFYRNVYRLLKPGGVFIFDGINRYPCSGSIGTGDSPNPANVNIKDEEGYIYHTPFFMKMDKDIDYATITNDIGVVQNYANRLVKDKKCMRFRVHVWEEWLNKNGIHFEDYTMGEKDDPEIRAILEVVGTAEDPWDKVYVRMQKSME